MFGKKKNMMTRLLRLLFLMIAGVAIAESQQSDSSSDSSKTKRNWQKETFHSIVAQFPEGPRHRNMFLIDFDDQFAWMGRHYGDNRDFGGNTVPGLFVYSKSHDTWIQILEVSTAGAKFGKLFTPKISAPWDFTDLASKPFVQVPISTSFLHFPDKVVYDSAHDVYTVFFDSRQKVDSAVTTLLISKKDLLEAFSHFNWHE